MFEQIAASLPPEIYQEFRRALDCGKWRNGNAVTDKQRLTCQRALFFHELNCTNYYH
ncbi:DUF1315 family protein [Psychrobium sp. nBUS_13]|uniref:DUF1315 family protein n=1 Tax=Psychrobium sp. nBUS_13 TaxID=3395319 RepID=UPI003EB8087D